MVLSLSHPKARGPHEASVPDAVLGAMRDAVIVFDAQGIVLSCNPAARVLLGGWASDLLGSRFDEAFEDQGRTKTFVALRRFLTSQEPYQGPQSVVLAANAAQQVSTRLTPVRTRGGAGALILWDDSEQVAFTRLLEHAATHDRLTGLPNRTHLKSLLGGALARAREQDGKVALLFVGLDDFRSLNDARGHEAGDVVLAETARRMRRSLRGSEGLVRAGGDEFVLVLDRMLDSPQALNFAQVLLKDIQRPYRAAGSQVRLSACIGVVLADGSRSSPASLLHQGDAALHRAKATGPGHVEVFDQGSRDQTRARHVMEVAVTEAHLANDLEVHYQPLVGVNPVRWAGFEALIRWTDDEGTRVSPGTFVPALERTGQIVAVGKWVLQRACEDLLQFQRRTAQENLHMAVNLSVQQLQEPDFVQLVQQTLARTGVRPQDLVLEVTEGALALDASGVIQRLGELKTLGVSVSIDDFGTGYSSLAYLRNLPAHVLKIDQSFVRSMLPPDNDMVIVEAICGLAQSVGLKIVAEGVETEVQARALEGLGVDYLQGYRFSRAVPADEIEAVLGQKPSL